MVMVGSPVALRVDDAGLAVHRTSRRGLAKGAVRHLDLGKKTVAAVAMSRSLRLCASGMAHQQAE